MVDVEHAKDRLVRAARDLQPYKDAAYRKRCIALGDESALASAGVTGMNADTGHDGYRSNQNARPDIRVTSFKEARNNGILNLIGVIIDQSNFAMPAARLSGVSEIEQIVNAAYLDRRLAQCNADKHLALALGAYLMNGLGVMYSTIRNGRPIFVWADDLDLKWDVTAKLPIDAGWMSLTVCKPLRYWQSVYSDSKVLSELSTTDEDKGGDRPIELDFYYDLDGDAAVFYLPAEDQPDETVVKTGKNRCRDAYDEIALPFDPMTFMSMPTSRDSISMVEKMLPAQIATWEAMNFILENLRRGKAFYPITADGVDAKELQKFLDGYTGAVVKEKIAGSIRREAALPQDPVAFEVYKDNDAQLNRMAGQANSAVGAKTPGVKTKYEMQQIAQQSELTAAKVSQALVKVVSSGMQKMLNYGKRFDKGRFWCMVNGHRVDFGGDSQHKLGEILRPDATIVAVENSMLFKNKEQRKAEASQQLATAMNMAKLGTITKESLLLTYRDYLEAYEIPDIEERLKQPVQMQQQPQQPQQPAPGAPGTAAAGIGG